ncbi:MAG: protein phosphatase 2C domain-containing protein [Verrucomicrobiales bacterium]|nr:protein phosphatase 2C domain-containing protein [Verrucomicrobiales bacterium]
MSHSDPTTRDSEEEVPLAQGVTWSAISDVGRYRSTNEDAFLALRMDAREVRRLGKLGDGSLADGDFIFAVSDGMGGHNAGEFASRIAVEKITELLPSAFRLDFQGIQKGAHDLLDQVFHEIHEEIKRLGEAYEEIAGMGATLSLCWIGSEWMNFCHIGDSRIYYLPAAGGIKQISEDHTYVGWLEKTGKITAAQARIHPKKNQLTQALTATRRNIEVQVGAVGFEPGDRFVICSDGLYEGLSDPNIDHFVRTPPAHLADRTEAQRIVDESLLNSGKDNTTAVVVVIQ